MAFGQGLQKSYDEAVESIREPLKARHDLYEDYKKQVNDLTATEATPDTDLFPLRTPLLSTPDTGTFPSPTTIMSQSPPAHQASFSAERPAPELHDPFAQLAQSKIGFQQDKASEQSTELKTLLRDIGDKLDDTFGTTVERYRAAAKLEGVELLLRRIARLPYACTSSVIAPFTHTYAYADALASTYLRWKAKLAARFGATSSASLKKSEAIMVKPGSKVS